MQSRQEEKQDWEDKHESKVTVYFWGRKFSPKEKQAGVGHIALKTSIRKDGELIENYISLWPDDPQPQGAGLFCEVKSIWKTVGSGINQLQKKGAQGVWHTYADDVDSEGREADSVTELFDLHVVTINKFYQTWKNNPPNWSVRNSTNKERQDKSLPSFNCAVLTASLLKFGGIDEVLDEPAFPGLNIPPITENDFHEDGGAKINLVINNIASLVVLVFKDHFFKPEDVVADVLKAFRKQEEREEENQNFKFY